MTRARPTLPRFDVPQLAVHAVWGAWFVAFLASWEGLSPVGRAGMWTLGWAVLFWNYAVLHNHMHVPIARPRWARVIVSRTLGLACGFPYRGYFIHHFNHHRYNDGPGDWGRRRPDEGALRYCVRSALTPWLWPFGMLANVWRQAARHRQRAELILDFAVVDGTVLALIVWRPALGLSYWGMLLVGQMCILWLNLAAHFETDAGQRDALAVTSLSRLYNRVFFNAGHHQAHHLKPHVPWYELPEATRVFTTTGRVRPTLVTPLAPIHPGWVARVAKRYRAAPCNARTDPTTTSGTPSGVT